MRAWRYTEAKIKVLNKFVLANFTQEFRWLLISILHRLNNPLIVQGVIVCLTLFNLQGTDAIRSRG